MPDFLDAPGARERVSGELCPDAGTQASGSVSAHGRGVSAGPASDVAGLFDRIPQVDAIRRPARFPGLAGWGAAQWLVMASAAVLLFLLYGGLDAAAVALDVRTVVAASLLGSFVVATFAPRAGQKMAWSPCGLMPLLWVVLLPMVLASGGPMSVVLGLGMLGVFAVQRAMGVGCAM